MKIIKTSLLNELYKEFPEYKFRDESFQEFIDRTRDNDKLLVVDLGD